MFKLLQRRDKKMARRDINLQESEAVIRFPITVQSVMSSRRRQTAYDGLERLTPGKRAALGLDIGPAQLAEDASRRDRDAHRGTPAKDKE